MLSPFYTSASSHQSRRVVSEIKRLRLIVVRYPASHTPFEAGGRIPLEVCLTPLLIITLSQSLSPKPRKALEVIKLRLEIFLQQENHELKRQTEITSSLSTWRSHSLSKENQ